MKQTFANELTREDYERILSDMQSKLIIGPRERYRDESDADFEYRKSHFEKAVRGFMKMVEHQLGTREVYLR